MTKWSFLKKTRLDIDPVNTQWSQTVQQFILHCYWAKKTKQPNRGQLVKTSQSTVNFLFDCEIEPPKEMCVLITPVPHHYHPGENKSSNGVMKISPSGWFIHTLIVEQSQQTRRARSIFSVLLSHLKHGVKTRMSRRTGCEQCSTTDSTHFVETLVYLTHRYNIIIFIY